MMPFYDIGELVRVSTLFVDSTGASYDPTAVKFAYQSEAIGLTSNFTYGVGAVINKIATGSYFVDIDTTYSSGVYYWRFYAIGTGQTADQSEFYVVPAKT